MRGGTRTWRLRSRGGWWAVVASGIIAAAALPVAGQGTTDRPDPDAAQRLKALKEAAASYVLEREGDPPSRLTLVPEPALRWNNPLRIAYDGAVFVWVADGRPEVVASFYRNVQGGRALEHHEFVSLSQGRLTATSTGGEAWAPRSPGLEWKLVPGAPAPASGDAARRRQLRALVRDFQAGYVWEERTKGLSLRVLTKPLYEYQAAKPERTTGAVFAFVQATDPEALLVLETREVDGKPAWQYAFARMSIRGLRAWHEGRLVWEVPGTSPAPSTPYGNITLPVR